MIIMIVVVVDIDIVIIIIIIIYECIYNKLFSFLVLGFEIYPFIGPCSYGYQAR